MSEKLIELATCLNCGILLANLMVLGLSTKLYIAFAKERFKGKAQ